MEININNQTENDPVRDKLSFICREFRIPGELIIYRFIPSGHINTAYYVAMYDGHEVRQFLVQKINWYVFRDPVSMMRNIDLITSHIIHKEPTMERRRRLHFHHTAEGSNLVIIGEGENREYWRLYNFVESSLSFETADGNSEVLRMSGKAFGKFLRQLQDFDPMQLVESIPHFHDTPYRLNNFFKDVESDPLGRAGDASYEINVIKKYRDFAGTLVKQIETGELPIRVTHNDTKTNNILFDKDTLDPLVIIDLDTCMPGLACYDFGDTIRFGACTGLENDKDLSKMKVDMNLFRAYTDGYLSELSGVLSDTEIKSLVYGAAIITLELASRFLDDYIVGDKYFRIDYPEENLDRAKAQLALFEDMMLHFDDMNEVVDEIAETYREQSRG